MKKVEKLVEGFYTDNSSSNLIKIGERGDIAIAHTYSLFYIFQKDGDWMIELYNEPGETGIIYSPGGDPSLLISSPRRLNRILDSYRLLSKDEVISRISNLRKQSQEQKEQAETDLESLRQQEKFVKSKEKQKQKTSKI